MGYQGRLLGGGESGEMYSTQEAGNISGDCSSYGRGVKACIFDDPAPDMAWGMGGAGKPL